MDRNLPIGIFDSGVGGLTVYRALHTRLPSERYVYLGDTARVPYGTKSLATVERYAIENARFLEARGIKLLVVACNTASALALPAIRGSIRVPVVGMIGPGARAAVRGASASGRVGVIATESTIRSGAYGRAIAALAPGIAVTERACPLFVPLAEEGWAESDVARAVAEEYLRDLREAGARERFLCDDLDHFYVTDAEERFARVAERFLGSAPRRLEAVEVWGHDELHAR